MNMLNRNSSVSPFLVRVLGLLLILSVAESSAYAQSESFYFMCSVGKTLESFANVRLVGDKDQALKTAFERLKSQGYDFRLVQRDSILVGSRRFGTKAIRQQKHFESNAGFWVDMLTIPADDSAGRNALRELKNNQKYSGSEGTRYWSFISMSPKPNNSVTAYVTNGTEYIVVGAHLGFPIPRTLEDLSAEEQEAMRKGTHDVRAIVYELIRNLVAHEDFSKLVYPEVQLTADQRIYGLVQFWTEVKYNFAFFDKQPDLNWDAKLAEYLPLVRADQSNFDYFRTLQKLCATLKDGHTGVNLPMMLNAEIARPPIRLENIEHRAIVTNVGMSLKDQIAIGSEVVAVDGLPTDQYLQDRIFPYISSSTEYILWDRGIRDMLEGKRGTIVALTLKNRDGKKWDVNLTRGAAGTNGEWVIEENRSRENVEFRWLQDSIAYVAINTFNQSSVVTQFAEHLKELLACRGLIIDIRSNGGGNSTNATDVISYLTDKPFLTSKWRTREHRAAFKAWGSFEVNKSQQELAKLSPEEKAWSMQAINNFKGTSWYEGSPDTITPPKGEKVTAPMVVLVGHNTASAAEDFLISLDYLKRGVFVGGLSYGSTGQPLFFDLPGGGSARVCTKRDTYPDGREFVGYGVKPDVAVEPTVDDYIANRDVVLERGIMVLKERMNIR